SKKVTKSYAARLQSVPDYFLGNGTQWSITHSRRLSKRCERQRPLSSVGQVQQLLAPMMSSRGMVPKFLRTFGSAYLSTRPRLLQWNMVQKLGAPISVAMPIGY